MLSAQDIALKEYELVCANLQARSARILTIKSWGITIAAGGLGTSAQLQSDVLLFLVSAACLTFWALEAGLQGAQKAMSARAKALEVFLSDGAQDAGFKAPWQSQYRANSPTTLFAIRRAFMPKVFVPSGLVGFIGLAILVANGFFVTFALDHLLR